VEIKVLQVSRLSESVDLGASLSHSGERSKVLGSRSRRGHLKRRNSSEGGRRSRRSPGEGRRREGTSCQSSFGRITRKLNQRELTDKGRDTAGLGQEEGGRERSRRRAGEGRKKTESSSSTEIRPTPPVCLLLLPRLCCPLQMSPSRDFREAERGQVLSRELPASQSKPIRKILPSSEISFLRPLSRSTPPIQLAVVQER